MTLMITKLFYLISLLPLWLMYCISDVVYIFAYYILRYRQSVVRRNLVTSFPERSSAEIARIERKFYRWLCDSFFESIKLLSIKETDLRKHFSITNPEIVEAYFQKGINVSGMLGHYGNWEWLSCVGIDLPPERKMGLIYKPLRSKAIDDLYIALRTAHDGVVIPKDKILRYRLRFKRDGIMNITGYIADQAPKWEDIHLWLPFLNHDTPVFTGSERIIRKMNTPVMYVDMQRIKRGKYVCTFELLCDAPAELPENELTRMFFARLERAVSEHPETYLWSHDRWKRTHEEFNHRFHVEHGRVIKNQE